MGIDLERASGIELLHEAEQRRTRECATQAAAEFIDSVLAIYRSNDAGERRPEHIGSCILLDIDGTPVVATAAHIVDNIPEGATLFVASPVRPQLVPIMGGKVKSTPKPPKGRDHDHSDSAYWQMPDDVVAILGPGNFLGSSRLAHNRAPLERRLYTALGYAVERNAHGVDHERRTITFVPSMHTSNAVSEPKLTRRLNSQEDQHIFVRFAKRAQDADGVEMKTFHPEGLSGGALLDLGDFTSYDIYTGDTKYRARLAGMIIEYHGDRRALVAVKIGPIVSGIRNALARSA
jgi:hypothetical protein